MYHNFIDEPKVENSLSIAFLINIIAIIILKIYLYLTESTETKIVCIINITSNIIMIIALFIFIAILKKNENSICLYFIGLIIYLLFLQILIFGIILRASLFEYIRNKYIVCTIIELICAQGVLSISMNAED